MIESQVTMTINERQFQEAAPVYVTFPHVSFDGFNFHLVFLSGTPHPIDTDDTPSVRVSARLVMPPVVADATVRALLSALKNPQPTGILADLMIASEQEETNDDD